MTDSRERIRFAARTDAVRVIDTIERSTDVIGLDETPTCQPALTDVFPFPVDSAIGMQTSTLEFRAFSRVAVRDESGDLLADFLEPMTLPSDTYFIDVTGTTKVYLRVTDTAISATGMLDGDTVRITFDEPTCVTIGARSFHTRPAATMTVPDDAAALATAVSHFGSAIKEWSPEKSWPTLRGYPPRIQCGTALDIPDNLLAPETGVTITVPDTLSDVYRVTPLAYYLGATVQVGDDPGLYLDTGYTERLPDSGRALERNVAALLGRCLLLDSLARTEGYVPSDRHEYDQLGSKLPFYPPNLMDRTPSERLMEYLEVRPSVLEPFLPNFPVQATVGPGDETVPLLPHLAYVLAPLRVDPTATRIAADDPASTSVGWAPLFPHDGASLVDRRTDSQTERTTVTPEDAAIDGLTDPRSHTTQPSTALLTPEVYENHLDRTRSAQGTVDVVVVARDANRATRLSATLIEPDVPDGVNTLSVVNAPTSEELINRLEANSVDILVAPAECIETSAWTDTVTPMVTVVAGQHAQSTCRQAVEAGVVAAIATADSFDPERLRRLLGLLAVGTPFGPAIELASTDDGSAVWLWGDPSATGVIPHGGSSKQLATFRSRSETEHDATQQSLPSFDMPSGGESWGLPDWCLDSATLIGTPQGMNTTVDTQAILELLTEPDAIVRVNGTVVLSNDEFTSADVARSARRAVRQRSDASPDR